MERLSTEVTGLSNQQAGVVVQKKIGNESLLLQQNAVNTDQSSDLNPNISGAFLEDAVVVSCGHSFGGSLLRKIMETGRCTLCIAEIDSSLLVPNIALRDEAAAVKHEDDRRLFHNAALRKRRKELGDQFDIAKRQHRVSTNN